MFGFSREAEHENVRDAVDPFMLPVAFGGESIGTVGTRQSEAVLVVNVVDDLGLNEVRGLQGLVGHFGGYEEGTRGQSESARGK